MFQWKIQDMYGIALKMLKKVGQIKGSPSQGLLLIEGIRESFVEEVTFKPGCEKVRKKASQDEETVAWRW